jgi:predicted AAA+ superfamily ATPase
LEFFQNTHKSLLESRKTTIRRELSKQIDWNQRLICIKGFRGVGKTTFLLDYIRDRFKDDNSVLYINLNNFYFTKRRISSFADEFVKRGGKVLVLDQIQKYPDWSADLRKCIDEIPELKIIFTSSPVLRITDGNPDLQGIASVNHLAGLSFREYLNYQTGNNFGYYNFDEIIENHVAIAREIVSKVKPLAYFGEYLKNGYFPYFIDDPNFYINRLLTHVNLALEIDVPYINQIELKYLSKLRKLLHLIAIEAPFTPNVSKLASAVETSRATVMNYLNYLKNAKLIHLLYSNGDDEQLKKPVKIYLHNTNLIYAIAPDNTESVNLRHTFFYNQVDYICNVKNSTKADFQVNDKYHFVVGGRKLEPAADVYAAADVIEIGEGNKIPLWLFGFLY